MWASRANTGSPGTTMRFIVPVGDGESMWWIADEYGR
jgi:hypothetical protein